MKRRHTFPALVFVILAGTVASTHSSSAVVTEQGPSAFGQGDFSFFSGLGTEHWGYSFDATANHRGQARGRATFNILENFVQTQVVVKINCLEVVGSSGFATAFLSGTVLHSDDPEFPKHANVVFLAEDNSNSPTFHPDIISRLFVFEGIDCHDRAVPLTFFQQSPDAITIEP